MAHMTTIQAARPAGKLADGHEQPATVFQPIHFLYTYLHEAIRHELALLSQSLQLLLAGTSTGWPELRRRYIFLRDVYKYHSAAEDEVCALCLDGERAAAPVRHGKRTCVRTTTTRSHDALR